MNYNHPVPVSPDALFGNIRTLVFIFRHTFPGRVKLSCKLAAHFRSQENGRCNLQQPVGAIRNLPANCRGTFGKVGNGAAILSGLFGTRKKRAAICSGLSGQSENRSQFCGKLSLSLESLPCKQLRLNRNLTLDLTLAGRGLAFTPSSVWLPGGSLSH